MEVKIERRFPLTATTSKAWSVLQDVRRTAACMPGAQITEQVDDSRFKGIVKSKVGPAQFTFGGDIEVQEVEPSLKRIRMHGKGSDKSGSTASMLLVASTEDAANGGSVLVGEATVNVGGKLAQFGNRLIIPVMDALLVQFAKNFDAQALATASVAENVSSQSSIEAAPAENISAHSTDKTVSASSELNVFSLVLAVVKDFFKRLFVKR